MAAEARSCGGQTCKKMNLLEKRIWKSSITLDTKTRLYKTYTVSQKKQDTILLRVPSRNFSSLNDAKSACLIAVVLVDVDLPYWTSKDEHLAAIPATVSNICTAHAQKQLFMHFKGKFRHCSSIR